MTPTSVPGRSEGLCPAGQHRRHAAGGPDSAIHVASGFTLVEILVVLIIIGLTAGLIGSIAAPDERSLLRLEAERLAQLLDLAAAESRLTGKRLAWTADAAGYRFWRFSPDIEWSEVRDVDVLRPRSLPQGMRIARFRAEGGVPITSTRLEFGPSGPERAFALDLTFGQARYSIEGSPIGEIRILPDDRVANAHPTQQ